jgi:homoserine acetyltransferase
MISYRTHHAYATKFGRSIKGGNENTKIEDRTLSDQWYQGSVESQWKGEDTAPGVPFEVRSYLNYQGARFVERKFDPNSYIVL